MQIKRNIVISLIVFIILCVGFVAWMFWQGSPKEILGVANQFKPDSSWKLISEEVNPPRTMCFDVICPSVSRSWTLPGPITNIDQFQKIATIGNKKMEVPSTCFRIIDTSQPAPSYSCDASYVLDNYQITLSYYDTERPAIVDLTVEKVH